MATDVREPSAAAAAESQLLERLRAGDEQAFTTLVASYHPTMLSVAQNYVKTRASAEEVVQEAWLGVIKGLDRFEGRSSLKTWILRILVNIAKTRGVREARSVPFARSRARQAPSSERFAARALPGGSALERRRETIAAALRAIEALPPAQRTVITMRDVAGCDSEEVCALLEISEGNQRVLLHRARSRVRAALEEHLDA